METYQIVVFIVLFLIFVFGSIIKVGQWFSAIEKDLDRKLEEENRKGKTIKKG